MITAAITACLALAFVLIGIVVVYCRRPGWAVAMAVCAVVFALISMTITISSPH
jgi:hypothetical protein